jgi:hypothetical protein
VEAVRDAAELLAPRADELSGAIEYDDGVGLLAGRVHGVVHVDVTLRVLHDAVRVAPGQAGRQLAPIVVGFIGVGARAHDRLLRTGLVLHAQQGQGDDRDGGGRVQELASGAGHGSLGGRAM